MAKNEISIIELNVQWGQEQITFFLFMETMLSPSTVIILLQVANLKLDNWGRSPSKSKEAQREPKNEKNTVILTWGSLFYSTEYRVYSNDLHQVCATPYTKSRNIGRSSTGSCMLKNRKRSPANRWENLQRKVSCQNLEQIADLAGYRVNNWRNWGSLNWAFILNLGLINTFETNQKGSNMLRSTFNKQCYLWSKW